MGIYDAFEPVEAPHTPAPEPPKYGFGVQSFAAGRNAGLAGVDWGGHQYTYESDIVEAFRDGLKKKGVDAPKFEYAAARDSSRLADAQVRDLPYGLRSAANAQRQFWALVQAQRTMDPKFMSDYADVIDGNSLADAARKRRKKDEEAARTIYGQSTGTGKAAWWMGNFAAGFNDPLSYLPIGGGVSKGATAAMTVLKTAGRDAALNAAAALAVEPLTRSDAKKQGQKRTIGDTAIDVGFAGLLGGFLGGVDAGIDLGLHRPGGLREAADQIEGVIGPDRMTPDERAAVAVARRDVEVREASPFLPTAGGDKEHGTRLAIAMASLESDRPVPEFSRSGLMAGASRGAIASSDGATQFKAMVRKAESGGDDFAQARTSSAGGRYQFTDATWLTYYKRTFPANGLSDAQILAKKTDGTVQDRLMDALTQDNVRLLQSAEQEASAGNLYMLHFLGPRGLRVLRAADDTPVAELLPREFIEANRSVLDGKTAGEVIAWADRKMGGEGVVRSAQADVPTLRPELFGDTEAHIYAQTAVRDDGPDFDLAAVGQWEGRDADWFRGSVVVDDQGEPMKLYHGSSDVIEQWRPDREATGVLSFSTSPGFAANYAATGDSPTVYPVFVSAKNVGDFRNEEHVQAVIRSAEKAFEEYETGWGRQEAARWTPEQREAKRAQFVNEPDIRRGDWHYWEQPDLWNEMGWDGAWVRESEGMAGAETVNLAVPNPEQVKFTTATDLRRSAPEPETVRAQPAADRVVQEAEAQGPIFDDPNGADATEQLDSVIHDLVNDPADGGFRLADEGTEQSLEEVLLQAEADQAAIEAARNCL